jgi:carbamoyltransferase
MYEEAFFHLIRNAQAQYGSTNLALAGGCAMNSVANGKVRRVTPFRRVHVQPAAGDAGGGVGAIRSEHRRQLSQVGCTIEEGMEDLALCHRTAAAIADGKVVGWFQGRMEWGPRALGNRSIVCDPRRPDMKAILNAKIKRENPFGRSPPLFLKRLYPNGLRRMMQFLS